MRESVLGTIKETYFGIPEGNAFLEREFKSNIFRKRKRICILEPEKGTRFWGRQRE